MRAYVRARANKWAFDAAAEVRRGQENKAKVLSARLELEQELGIELLPPSPAAERARERESGSQRRPAGRPRRGASSRFRCFLRRYGARSLGQVINNFITRGARHC